MRNLPLCTVVLACSVLALACRSAWAEDKKENRGFSGTWVKKDADLRFEFSDKNVLKIFPHGDKAEICIVCKFEADKDGIVKAKITELEGKAELTEKAKQVVPVGLEFSFKCTIKENVATLDDIKGDKVDALKSHLEGEYEKK